MLPQVYGCMYLFKLVLLFYSEKYPGVELLFSILFNPGGSEVKVSACNAGDLDSIPGSGRPPGEGNGNLLLYSCLENPRDREAWWATVHGIAKSRT